ncbi:MAG: hypothetical protein GX322_11720 [Firmicutes bacterium]|nr:hypothetical protein [Bacillota bacterium]
MNPDVNKAFFKVAFWISVISGFLMFHLEPGTPSYVINVASLVVGITLMGVIVLFLRISGTKED